MINPGQRRNQYKSTCPAPYTLNAYGVRTDRRGILHVNQGSAVDGTINYTDDSLVGRGVTGRVFKLGSPTGYYDDRWDRQYEVGTTGCLSWVGATGSNGTFEIDFRIDMSGITGIAYQDYYGMEFTVDNGASGAPVTGLHTTTQTVFYVDDTMG